MIEHQTITRFVIPAYAGIHERVKQISREYYVYILASKKYGTLYIGVTADLLSRVLEHRKGLVNGFTKKYNVNMLVYYEEYQYVEDAIVREKQLKKWNRKWKIGLIEKDNPDCQDLYLHLNNARDGFPLARE